jgi:molybdenum cofactor cytidylyltransferase
MTKIAALLMAAGHSRRMGGPNKLWLPFKGISLIVFSSNAVMRSSINRRLMVTGRDAELTGKYGTNCGFDVIYNPDFESGFGTSLSVGFSNLLQKPDVDGALVMLADMPLITAAHINQLVEAFDAARGQNIIRAAYNGHPGNPVVIPRPLFYALSQLTGDKSGQDILKTSGFPLSLVEIGHAAIADIDTPEALDALQGAAL